MGLIENGAEINRANNKKQSSLYMAAMNGHAEVVRLLLNAKASHKPDKDRITPRAVAEKNGHKKCVQEFSNHNNRNRGKNTGEDKKEEKNENGENNENGEKNEKVGKNVVSKGRKRKAGKVGKPSAKKKVRR